MAANFSKPTTASPYTDFPDEIRDNQAAAVTVHETDGSSNKPTGAKRISADGEVQRWSGAAWVTQGWVSNRPAHNLIINGAMAVAQRGTSFASPGGDDYLMDRWFHSKAGTGATVTITQDSSAPTLSEAGVVIEDSLKVDVTSADASPADAGDTVVIGQRVEGYRMRGIHQRSFTLSFWVKSTTTGIYCVAFTNSGFDRSYVAEYTIDLANTWEKKTITVTDAVSGGTWDFTNGVGLVVYFTLMAGSTYQTTADAWQSGSFLGTANQTNLMDDTANDWFLTGVQLEEGVNAKPFEDRDYAEELALCQRYCFNMDSAKTAATGMRFGFGFCTAATGAQSEVRFPVEMRDSPAMTAHGTASNYTVATTSGVTALSVAPTAAEASPWNALILSTVAAGLTADQPMQMVANSNNVAFLLFDAEL